MENIYVFRVVKTLSDWNFELLRQDIVLLTCVQDVERYKKWLQIQYEKDWMVEVNVSPLAEHLVQDDDVQRRLLSVM